MELTQEQISQILLDIANSINIELAQLPPAVWLVQLVEALAAKSV